MRSSNVPKTLCTAQKLYGPIKIEIVNAMQFSTTQPILNFLKDKDYALSGDLSGQRYMYKMHIKVGPVWTSSLREH